MTSDYKIGDKVKVICNSIEVGVGIVESINDSITGHQTYCIKLDTPITHVECLTDDLDIDVNNGKD